MDVVIFVFVQKKFVLKKQKSENIFVVKYIRRVVIRKVFDKRYTYLYYGRAYNKARKSFLK